MFRLFGPHATFLCGLTLLSGFIMVSTSMGEDLPSALQYQVKSIDGQDVDLKDYKGNVVLIVNVASECGLTGQYKGLQSLYDKYKDQGFVVLGFPCNQFGTQEPGSDAEIKQFCSTKFNVSFPMFSKIDVNGPTASPIYQHLTSQETEPVGKGAIKWNFEKFLINREGNIASRFAPTTAPSDAELVKAIESEIGK